MSDAFTASIGVVLDAFGGWVTDNCTKVSTPAQDHEARKEFYLHERDKELGRWRDPERPNRTVAFKEIHIDGSDERGRFAVVYDEQTMTSFGYWEHSRYIPFGARETEVDWAGTLERFFAAHPEPRPWHDAKPGEVWVLTLEGEPETAQVVDGYGKFMPWPIDVVSDGNARGKITAGRRIFPEVSP